MVGDPLPFDNGRIEYASALMGKSHHLTSSHRGMSRMSATFFERPILNSPYRYPSPAGELTEDIRPANAVPFARRVPA